MLDAHSMILICPEKSDRLSAARILWKIRSASWRMDKLPITLMQGKIRFQGNPGLMYITPDQLLVLKAESHYSRIFTENGQEILVSQSLSEIELVNLLPFPKLFISPVRSTILSLRKIVSIQIRKNEWIISRGNETLNVKIPENGLKIVFKAIDKLPNG